MNDPRCRREVYIRTGITVIMVAVATLFLQVDPLVWIVPPALALVTLLKWAVRPADEDEDQEGSAN